MERRTVRIGLALAAAVLAAAPAGAAEPLRLRLGGYSKWWISAQGNNAGYLAATGADLNQVDVKGDNEVHVLGDTRLDNGLTVGVKVELEAGGDTSQRTDPIDKAYVWVAGAWGKLELGSDYNAASLLHVAAPEAAGLWNGPPVGLMANTQVQRPAAVSTMYSGNQTELDHDDNADKLLYFTPSLGGLSAALSYTPSALSEDDRAPTRASEVVAAGLAYEQSLGPVAVALSAGYLGGSLDSADARAKVRALSAGLQARYDAITIGGSVGDDRHRYDNAPRAAAATDDSGRSWDVGVMVERDQTAVSLDYYRSATRGRVDTPGDDRVRVWQVSAKHILGPGVAVMGAFGHIRYDDESGARAACNDGYSLMTGLGLWF